MTQMALNVASSKHMKSIYVTAGKGQPLELRIEDYLYKCQGITTKTSLFFPDAQHTSENNL